MEPEQQQTKRVRLSDTSKQAQGVGQTCTLTAGPSSTTGATVAHSPAASTIASQQATKPPAVIMPPVACVSLPSTSSAAQVACIQNAAATGSAASTKPSNFIANAREVVHFRAVSSPNSADIEAEISSGGQSVTVDFLHQHFGDSEQIRGYSGLKISIWIHVRTYHSWVEIEFTAKRPGAERLGPIFEGAFPSGYCQSREEFVEAAAAAAAAMPDLMTLGDCVGILPLPPRAYGLNSLTTANAAATEGGSRDGSADSPLPSVSVRRFQLCSAPPEIKALHSRMEPLLLFTIDGAQFIDVEDAQWELLLPVVRAADGGCLVMGLTTLFNFYAYPASCRLRISQVLVLSPWQGLGLGKGLVKLSYDLAKRRGYADVTVEDPTPNLQRVREKLEVEMLRGLPWVAEEARKCLDTVARGETLCPGWVDKEGDPPTSSEHAPPPESKAIGTSLGSEPSGKAQMSAPPLLTSHAFFAALGAVPPPQLVVPEDVQLEAESRCLRHRPQEAERSTATESEFAGGTMGLPSMSCGAGAVGSNGKGSAAAGAVAALIPPPAFTSAMCRELKIHRGQIRIVWEALLWCEPGAPSRGPAVRRALEQLIVARLEAQHFSSIGRVAVAKSLVNIIRGGSAANNNDKTKADGGDGDFFMYRPMGRTAARASEDSAVDAGAIATGRLTLTQVTIDDKAKRLEEMLQERTEQLQSLAAVLNRNKQ